MASTPNDPARDSGDDILPTWDVPMALPVATPVTGDVLMALPVAAPVATSPALTPAPEPPVLAAPSTGLVCPACTSSNPPDASYCSDCGYYFSPSDRTRSSLAPSISPNETSHQPQPPAAAPLSSIRVGNRYEIATPLSSRNGVDRYRGIDLETGSPVMVVRQPVTAPVVAVAVSPETVENDDEIFPSFDDVTAFPSTGILPGDVAWPSIAWEQKLLATANSPALPKLLDSLSDETHQYLIEEIPQGRSLWDAWDEAEGDSRLRFGYLIRVAQLLQQLHQGNAILDGLRPEKIVITDTGDARLADLADLLPIPVPRDASTKGGPYSAPEITTGNADARADLYAFGAMLYSLHVGRELNERTDFDKPGYPKPFIPRFPDCHPAFGRLMMKTFRREVLARFPTDEAGREDATGFTELIRTLDVLGRTFDQVHLEIAAWTNTGIIRTGNEDAYAILHAGESRQEESGEAALILLCDGMGGYEAGEIAAAMTLQSLRQSLRTMKPFDVAAGASPFVTDPQSQMSRPEGHLAPPVNVETVKTALKQALRDANRLVFQTSRTPGSKRRGMGCTAEAVYIDGQNVIVGHVGDSRVYHLHEGRLVQLTRDQTLVNRLVELGQLTPQEAETHPRRNELQQAIGGQPDVEPGLYHSKISPGDWVIVCSDGLTGHVKDNDLKQMLQSEAVSAEMCARRLVNLTLIEGATDNVTVVAVRAT